MRLRPETISGIFRCLAPAAGKELARHVPPESAQWGNNCLRGPGALCSPWGHQLSRNVAQPAVAAVLSASDRIRDFAIIAHVDHGKTTLMDKLIFHGSGAAAEAQERVMDSGVFERERGITITSKYTSFAYKGFTLNAVDTPGHADFGGEVERILGMVDGCLLVVDATEGAMAQTKYVLGKALAMGLRPIVVLNKIDRTQGQARCDEVHSELFDLFATLGATDEQLDFPVLFASGRDGWATREYPTTLPPPNPSMEVLLDAIVEHVPPPAVATADAPFSMLVTMLEYDNYLGRICTGRVATGTVSEGDSIKVVSADGTGEEEGKVTKIMKRSGTGKVTMERAVAGDIVSVAGLSSPGVADTIAAPEVNQPLQAGQVDPPTLAMIFAPNDSPVGRGAGNVLTSQKIIERVEREAAVSVSLKVRRVTGSEDAIQVEARGELQLSLLIEAMRRDGFELQLSAPRILMKQDGTKKLEPIEEVTCEVPDDCVGALISSLQVRKGVLEDMKQVGESGRTRLLFKVPARGLLGFRTHFTTITRGEGILNRAFDGYEDYRGAIDEVRKGALISMAEGTANAYALVDLQSRGTLFIKDGDVVYSGMIVGESNTEGDLEVNPAKEKKLSNVRSKQADEKLVVIPPKVITLEDAIGYIQWDELIEVTPTAVRLRKKVLNPAERKRFLRSNNELS